MLTRKDRLEEREEFKRERWGHGTFTIYESATKIITMETYL